MANSLVLITVDCLRFDHVGFMGYVHSTTPFLDSLAGESIVFQNAIVGGVPTYYSLPALLASRHPLKFGRDVVGLSEAEVTLASALKSAGYATASFTAGNPYISPRFGYDLGFDNFRNFLDLEPAATNGSGDTSVGGGMLRRLNQATERICRRVTPLRRIYEELYFQYCQRLAAPVAESLDSLRKFPAADVLVDQAKAWLARVGGAPFFLWLHFMDPHGPYYPKQEALRAIGHSKITPQRARYLNVAWTRSLGTARFHRYRQEILPLYDACIRWVDQQVACLVEALKQLQLWDNSVLAFTADHGEEFLEHGARFHAPWTMKEELIHVPLLLRWPSVKPARPKSPISHVDVAPTLLSAIDIPIPDGFEGTSRWQALQLAGEWDEPAIVDSTECINPNRLEARLAPRVLCVREKRFKLILRLGSDRKEELFDLDADPGEQRPIPVGTDDAPRRRLLQRASRHLAETQSGSPRSRLRARLSELRFQIETSVGPFGEHYPNAV
jgi:arylsulfatase A-like enzyme